MVVRRITVELDVPTRDGETEVHILTNLPAEAADALAIASLYRRRWTVEAAFGELATCLNGEVNTLGYPKAALFGFCVALVSYNVMSVVKAALRSVHGEEVVEGLSSYYLAEEVSGTHRGMMIAIPEDEWAVFHGLTAAEFGKVACPPKAGPVLMGVVQLAESQGATHAKTTRTRTDRQDPPRGPSRSRRGTEHQPGLPQGWLFSHHLLPMEGTPGGPNI